MSVTTTSTPKGGTAVATTTPADNTPAGLKAGLERMRPQLAVALPQHISVERFERVVLTAVNVNLTLIDADRRSLFNACQRAAQDGLLPDGREAALVIFNTKIKRDGKEIWISAVQYMPMVYGIIKKVRQSGEVVEFRSRIVYEKDTFSYVLGDDERIDHEPYKGEGDAGKIVKVYAIAKGANGWIEREVMTVAEVEKVRAVSKAKNNGPWVDWWSEMARKTVMRRLSKRLPVSSEIMAAFEADDDLRGNDAPPPRPTRDLIEHGGDRQQQEETETKPYEAISANGLYEAISANGEVNQFTSAADAATFVLKQFETRPDALLAIFEHNADLLARFDEEKCVDQAHAIRNDYAIYQKKAAEAGGGNRQQQAGGDSDEDPIILPLPAEGGDRNGWLKAVVAQIDGADVPTLERIIQEVDAIENLPNVLGAEITKAEQARRKKLPKKAA